MRDLVVDSLFLHLLEMSIFERPADLSRFGALDAQTWDKVIKLAWKQRVSALVAKSILSLPKEFLPPRKCLLHLFQLIEQTKITNNRVISALHTISREYAQLNIPFLLLKGPASGYYYPNPCLRTPGDLDLLLYRKGDYDKARDWVTGQGIHIVKANGIHSKFYLDEISIENHHRITYFSHKKYDRRFRSLEEDLFCKENFCHINIGGQIVQQLPVELNAFFLFQHLFRHFAHNGIGFRQFCDWILFLSKNHHKIDRDSFIALSQYFDLLCPMQVFARVAEKYLNVSLSIFPFPTIKDNKYADLVIDDILDGGNFGFYRSGKKRPKQKLQGMWYSYSNTLQRAIKFGALSPEHCLILPYTKFMNRLKIGLR